MDKSGGFSKKVRFGQLMLRHQRKLDTNLWMIIGLVPKLAGSALTEEGQYAVAFDEAEDGKITITIDPKQVVTFAPTYPEDCDDCCEMDDCKGKATCMFAEPSPIGHLYGATADDVLTSPIWRIG